MKSSDPILPIRREVGNSSYLKNLNGSQKPEVPTNARTLRFESLEDRRVLSATGFESVAPDTNLDNSAFVSSVEESNFGFQQDEAISSLTLLVNGEERRLSDADNVLNLVVGDTVEVSEIAFSSNAQEGVFAAEGYINKIGDLTSASLIDYNDGRFSDSSRDFAANGGDGVVAGLNNSWTVEAGWDRLTLNLIHYTEAATDVAGRFFVNLQVGQPDFAFDTEVLDQVTQQEITVGDQVVIPGGWFNNRGTGLFHNYAEVDIYHDSNPDAVIWAGALVGNVGDSVEGEFVNTRANDGFSERWTPDAPGEYTLRYYIDPENSAAELDESNNFYEIKLTVKGEAQPAEPAVAQIVALDDTLEAGDSLNVVENDQVQLTYQEDFESSETLGWTINPNGTDTATTGVWEATTPVGTAWNGVELQLEAAQGNSALVTGGQDDGTVGINDLDGGVTSVVSELLAVPANVESTLSFEYSFAHLHNSSSDDFFRVSVVGENQTEVVLEERGDSVDRAGQWTEFKTDLTSYAGQNVQLLVEAGDLSDSSLVEAGIDNVEVTSEVIPVKINEFTQGENGTVELNEDGTFNYTAEPGFNGQDSFTYSLTDGDNVSNTATVNVNVVSDFAELGIMAQTSGDLPVDAQFFGIQEVDGQTITLRGLPEFVTLSAGTFDGQVWTIDAADLEGLQVKSETASDTQGWSNYQDAYDFRNWDVRYTVTDGQNNVVSENSFQFATWQRAAVEEVSVGDRSGFEFENLNDFFSPERNSGGYIVTYQYTVNENSFATDSSQPWTIDGGYRGDGEITNVFVNGFSGPTNRSADGSFDIGNTEVGFRPDLRVGDTFSVSFQVNGAGYSPEDFDLVLTEVNA